jgi:hypothetical protein
MVTSSEKKIIEKGDEISGLDGYVPARIVPMKCARFHRTTMLFLSRKKTQDSKTQIFVLLLFKFRFRIEFFDCRASAKLVYSVS